MFNSLVLYGTYIAKDFRYNEQFELNEQRIQSAIWYISLGSTDFFSGISPEELRSHDYDLYKRKKNEQIGVVSNNQPVIQTVPCPFFQPSTNIFLNNSSNNKSNNIDLNNNMNNPFNLPLYSPVTHVPIPKVCLIDANVNTPIKIVNEIYKEKIKQIYETEAKLAKQLDLLVLNEKKNKKINFDHEHYSIDYNYKSRSEIKKHFKQLSLEDDNRFILGKKKVSFFTPNKEIKQRDDKISRIRCQVVNEKAKINQIIPLSLDTKNLKVNMIKQTLYDIITKVVLKKEETLNSIEDIKLSLMDSKTGIKRELKESDKIIYIKSNIIVDINIEEKKEENNSIDL